MFHGMLSAAIALGKKKKKTVSKPVCWSPRRSGVQSLVCLPDESGGDCAPGQVVIEVGGSLHTVPVGDQGLGDCFQKG